MSQADDLALAAPPSFKLRPWAEEYRDAFAQMHEDSLVMADLGGPFDRAASNEKFDRYRDAWAVHGISRWAIVDVENSFLGYVGIMRRADADHPLGPHFEVGWRLRRAVWGMGYATEGARRALKHAWSIPGVAEIVSYTSAENGPSRKVMERLGLRRDPTRDFTARYPRGDWNGLVWVADRPASLSSTRVRVD